jgi:hypothetical protein
MFAVELHLGNPLAETPPVDLARAMAKAIMDEGVACIG